MPGEMLGSPAAAAPEEIAEAFAEAQAVPAQPEGPPPHKVAQPEESLQLVRNRAKSAENEREAYRQKWDRWRKLLKGEIVIPESREGLNNINDAVLWEAVQVEHARLISAIFDAPPLFPLRPVGGEDQAPSENMQKFLQWQVGQALLDPETSPWIELDRSLGAYAMMGGAFWNIAWDFDKKLPILEIDDVQNWLVDPNALKRKGMRYAIHMRVVTRAWVEERIAEGFYDAENLKDLLEAAQSEVNTGEESKTREVQNPTEDGSLAGESERGRHDQTFRLAEYFEPDRLIHVLNDKAAAHDGPSPYNLKEIPVWYVPYGPLPDELLGVGMGQMGETTQYEINAKANQALDYVDMILNPPFLKRRGADIQDSQCAFAPGVWWEVDDINNDVKALFMPNQITGTIPERADLRIALKNRLGATDYSQGIPGKDRVAQTVRLLIEQVNLRMGVIAKRLFEYGIRNWYRWTLALDLQFLGVPDEAGPWERVMGNAPNPFKVDPETGEAPTLETLTRDLAMPASYLQGSKVLKQENFVNAFGAVTKFGPTAAILDPQALALEIFRLFDVPNPERLFAAGRSPEEELIGQENEAILQGVQPVARLQQDHQAHMMGHAPLFQALDAILDGMIPEVADVIRRAATLHMKAHQQMQITINAQRQQMAAQAGAQGGGAPAAGHSPAGAQERTVEAVGEEAAG